MFYSLNHSAYCKQLETNTASTMFSGELTALSVGTCIDTDDCAAIIPSGHLVLNLTKETFQSLGLEGSQSAFTTERYGKCNM